MLLARDVIQFGWGALKGYRSRTLLMLLAMTIGVAAVLMLTALGEGARRYVRNEFASLGTNLVIILPGRSETAGVGLGCNLWRMLIQESLGDYPVRCIQIGQQPKRT